MSTLDRKDAYTCISAIWKSKSQSTIRRLYTNPWTITKSSEALSTGTCSRKCVWRTNNPEAPEVTEGSKCAPSLAESWRTRLRWARAVSEFFDGHPGLIQDGD